MQSGAYDNVERRLAEYFGETARELPVSDGFWPRLRARMTMQAPAGPSLWQRLTARRWAVASAAAVLALAMVSAAALPSLLSDGNAANHCRAFQRGPGRRWASGAKRRPRASARRIGHGQCHYHQGRNVRIGGGRSQIRLDEHRADIRPCRQWVPRRQRRHGRLPQLGLPLHRGQGRGGRVGADARDREERRRVHRNAVDQRWRGPGPGQRDDPRAREHIL